MSKVENALLAIAETEQGLEVRISEKAYGNLAVVGLLEQIKFNLLSVEETPVVTRNNMPTDQKYDA